jgi:hypothetical protein
MLPTLADCLGSGGRVAVARGERGSVGASRQEAAVYDALNVGAEDVWVRRSDISAGG